MLIKFENGKDCAINDFKHLETSCGYRLPIEYRDFVRKNDGARVSLNFFKVDELEQGGITQFIPIQKVLLVQSSIDGLPSDTLPIAWAECGNLLVIKKNGSQIYYWQHELAGQLVCVGDNLNSFLDAVQPLSLDDVQVRPEQIKRVWIDPDFFDNLKKDE